MTGHTLRRWGSSRRDRVADVSDEPVTADDVARLRAELATVRAELAAVREEQERWEEQTQKVRTQRDRAVKSADALSEALAHHLRVDSAGLGKGAAVRRKRQQPISRTEAAHVELLRASDLFDAAWYLKTYLDVAERGDDPALHFLRHPYQPTRLPSERFDTLQYASDHPEVREKKLNPLVHFLLSPQSQGAECYPPEARAKS